MSLPSSPGTRLQRLRNHFIFENIKNGLKLYLSDSLTAFFLVILAILVFLALFGPTLAPYQYDEVQRGENGQILLTEPPSSEHWLGTNSRGYDVLSRLLYGAQPTLFTGFLGGSVIVGIGLLVGVSAGYYGGRVDSILMRLTDFAYGIPLIPAAIVIVAYFGIGFWTSIAIIGMVLWRGNARVFRSQVLQIKEREHVKAAKMLGASDAYVIVRHILPNMGGMVVLFFALGTGLTILISASLAFLGFMNPFIPSWGVMLRTAYGSGYVASAWWWTLPSGGAISLTVLTVFMLGRGYERVSQTNVNEVQA
ncbi:MAG: ABC transporter permease [Halobacteriales archaeon]